MSNRSISLTDELYQYLLSVSLRESEVLKRLREETARIPMARMQISPEQGQFMALLAQIVGARRVIEVGVFTGYSSVCVASALPPDGRLIACDVSEEWTGIARRYWREAGVDDKIDLRLGPALKTLDGLVSEGMSERFDFAFVDADKTEYQGYLERCATLLRPGGLIAVDNTLWGGDVINVNDQTDDTVAIRLFNSGLVDDARFDLSLVPIGDGLTLARKR